MRVAARSSETKGNIALIKKGKYFLPPETEGETFKELFRRMASAGAGRPVDRDGVTSGPWTPDLLATAISEFDSNASGIDLRTVQLWFQDNDRGISPENIRWLARVFGCDDPKATAEWQVALRAAVERQKRDRRQKQKLPAAISVAEGEKLSAPPAPVADTAPERQGKTELSGHKAFGLARSSEALFSRGSPLDLPASVFAGAVALGFVSYVIGIHNVTYTQTDGTAKQVGFLWAPNWTFVFMVFFPLFLISASETLLYWKHEGREILLTRRSHREINKSWMQSVEASSLTFWSVLLICIVFAGALQWVGVRLNPFLTGSNDYAMDWGSVALIHPQEISAVASLLFSGAAYLYMSLCFYILFVGFILLYTIAHDYGELSGRRNSGQTFKQPLEGEPPGAVVMNGIFRCSILGLLIAIAMKLQSVYLTSNSKDVLRWLLEDGYGVLWGNGGAAASLSVSTPNHYSSLVVVLATCSVFLYGALKLQMGWASKAKLSTMALVIASLCISYATIGIFSGFSLLMWLSLCLAAYGLLGTKFSDTQDRGMGRGRRVL